MKQIYHPYWKWEDFKNGMWKKISRDEEERLLPLIIEFKSNHNLYGSAMLEVIENWKFACEHNLSDMNINRRAWLGQSACNYKHGWPEYLVREAWNRLTTIQQSLANKMADEAILKWELKYKTNAETQLRIIGF